MIEFNENEYQTKRYFARLSPVREDPQEDESNANDERWQVDLAEYDIIELTEGTELDVDHRTVFSDRCC